jgi:hypothetical protein
MRKFWFSLFAVLVFLMTIRADERELEPLFNGSDFSGWQEPENNIWWNIEDGVLIGKNDPELTGSTLWTSEEYTDFILQLDFRFGPGSVDSGVFIHKESEQIQIGISSSLKRDMTCSPYVAGKGYPDDFVGVAVAAVHIVPGLLGAIASAITGFVRMEWELLLIFRIF